MAVASSGTGDSGDVHFINQTLWADLVSAHALVEETESGAYIGRGVAIGYGALAGGGKDGGCLGDCELLGCFFFFLPVFFFFFFCCCCCCCCEEVEVSGSDGSVELGVGDLDGLGLLGRESSIVLDVFESLIPNLQRFRPWINDSWSRRWAFQVEDSVSVTEVADVVPPGGLEVACPWRAILLVRGVVLLMAELWGNSDSRQVLWFDVLDAVFTGVDGHIRGAGVGGSGVDGGRSIDGEHWQRRGRKDKDKRKQVVELE